MFYIVKCSDLCELRQKWDAILVRNRELLPNARFKQTGFDVQRLAEHLARHPRIQWFYYSDNADGIALRLYDREFKNAYPEDYRESARENDEDWVILRGNGLGSTRDVGKRELRAAFGPTNCWNASQGPGDIRLGTDTEARLAYFQQQNNGEGAVMRHDVPPQNPRQNYLTSAIDSLHQFRQIILYGPPGTGKTRLARRAALALFTGAESAARIDSLTEDQVQQTLADRAADGAFDLVVFHPAYEYEQFVGGIAPEAGGQGLRYNVEPGVFLRIARWVEQNRRPGVLMIDEINRGNLPKLLGELLYALEYRDTKVRLPFKWQDRSDLVVPKDLYIIGTMNSSDRSIGHIDVAARRRFALLHIEPDPEIVRSVWQDIDPTTGVRLARLMERLNSQLDKEDRGGELRVGHAYFLPSPSFPNPKAQVERKWVYQVQQLLEEYRQLLNLDDEFFRQFPKKLDDALANIEG